MNEPSSATEPPQISDDQSEAKVRTRLHTHSIVSEKTHTRGSTEKWKPCMAGGES